MSRTKQRVKLAAAHTHARRRYAAGETIALWPAQIARIRHKIATPKRHAPTTDKDRDHENQ